MQHNGRHVNHRSVLSSPIKYILRYLFDTKNNLTKYSVLTYYHKYKYPLDKVVWRFKLIEQKSVKRELTAQN